MDRFTHVTGIAACLVRDNIDTDAIIPGDCLMQVAKAGFGHGLFANWRFADRGTPAEKECGEFVLNQPAFRQASILISGHNFGCGSSREPAVWALRDWGFRCVVAPSFGPIFYANCFRNGLLPAVACDDHVSRLVEELEASAPMAQVTVDLVARRVNGPGGGVYPFEIGEFFRSMLLEGWDAITATLRRGADIDRFQRWQRLERPWLHESLVAGERAST